MDTLTKKQRSERMALIHAKHTKPEIRVRKLIFAMGFRYRLHWGRLPGRPDIVFIGRKKVIFVHGCFWHLHRGCKNTRIPKSKKDFWVPKLEGNRQRDRKNERKLIKMGWKVMIIWECQTSNIESLTKSIKQFIEEA